MMMRNKLLYATGNTAKLSAMQARLEPLGIEVAGLQDAMRENPDIAEQIKNLNIAEDGRTPLENAEKKALAYYQVFRMPLFSCDSGLYIENIPEEEQPGVHVRTVHGKYLSDEEMLEHYTGLAKKYGDLKARYQNAVCLVEDETHKYSAMEESMAGNPFFIISKPHKDGIRKKGFPLDCISVHIGTGKYYYDLGDDELNQVAVEDGFLTFFRKYLEKHQ